MAIPDNWYPLKDSDRNPITITWEQVRAINHALVIWQQVYRKEKGKDPDLNNVANMWKSCLLGRILVEGKPPLENPPPVICSAPAYHLVDPDYCPNCGGLKSEPGKNLAASIDRNESIVQDMEKHRQINEPPLGKVVVYAFCNERCHPRRSRSYWLEDDG